MGKILQTYTGEQLYNMYRDYLLAKKVGLTDFNDGSRVKALIQSHADIISSVSMDMKEAIFRAIPVALYNGFGFKAKEADNAKGFIRPFRTPAITLSYSGVATSAKITITSSQIQAACVGASGDAFTYDFAVYEKTADLVAKINTLTNWKAVAVKNVKCSTLFQYSEKDVIGKQTYLRTSGMDIMLATDMEIPIEAGYSISVDSLQFSVLTSTVLPAGESGVQCSAQCNMAGTDGNILAGSIDTFAGSGTINSVVSGIEYVRNDSAFSGGTNAETDAERKVRFIKTVNALNAGTLNGITSALLSVSGVKSVDMLSCFPYRGMNTIIVDDGSGSIGTTLLTSLEKVLYGDPDDIDNFPGKNAEGIGYTFVPPTSVAVNIGITVYRLSEVKVSLSTISTAVQSAIEQYINTLPIGNDVILSEIVRVAKNANSAIYDVAITSPSANITIADTYVARTGAGTAGTVVVTPAIISEA